MSRQLDRFGRRAEFLAAQAARRAVLDGCGVLCLGAFGAPITVPDVTSEYVCHVVPVPAAWMGRNGVLRISVRCRFDNSQAGTKVWRARLGGASLATFSGGGATFGSISHIAWIQNRDNVALQLGNVNSGRPFQENATMVWLSGAVNTDEDQELKITLQKTVATDLAVLEQMHVELIRPFA